MLKLFNKAINVFLHKGIKTFLIKSKNKVIFTWNRIIFRPYITTICIDSEYMKILISDLFAKACYDNSENLDEWKELLWLKSNLLVEGDIVADCGANIGLTGLFFARCVGSTGKVVGFEALPANARVANENIQLNQVKNFEIQNQALGSHEGTIEFIDAPNGSVGQIEGMKSIIVPMTTLDKSFIKEQPTFLKIDVEGYEIEVLKGAKNILTKKPKLDIEIHCSSFDNPLNKVSEILAILSLSDYHIYLQLIPNGEISFYPSDCITPELIAQYDNVHLFAIPQRLAD